MEPESGALTVLTITRQDCLSFVVVSSMPVIY